MAWSDGLDLCARVLELAGGDAEVAVSESGEGLLRFAENQPIDHPVYRKLDLRLRLRDGQRYGEGTASSDSPDALAAMVAQAREQLASLPPEPNLMPSVGPQEFAPVDAWVDAASLEAFDAEARASAAAAMIAPAKRAGLRAAGVVKNGFVRVAQATSHGMSGSYSATSADWDLTAMADDASGRASAWSRNPATVDPAALGERAAEGCLRARNPVDLEPGCYRVVLSAHAVEELLGWLASGFNARAVADGQTWVVGRQGERVAPERVALIQDVAHPALLGQPFDGDCLPVRRVALIEEGIARNLLYDRRTAAEQGAEPTGWSGGGRNAYGAGAASVVFPGDGKSLEALLCECEDGVYVERLWYSNWVEPRNCVVTGMTRDGVFRIRDGQLAEPLRNLRFSQNLLQWLNAIEATGDPLVTEGSLVPAVLSGCFTFSSGTTF